MRLGGLDEVGLPLGDALDAKLSAVACYASQIGFQFGGAEAMRELLWRLALHEGGGVVAERFRATPAALRLLHG